MSVPTAEEYLKISKSDTYAKVMIEFTKLHCQEQAQAIYESGLSGLTEWHGNPYSGEGSDELSLNAIKNAYPLTNIK